MPLVIAHAGHWLLNLLYVAPVLVFVVVLSVISFRDRRRMRREEREQNDGLTPDRRTP